MKTRRVTLALAAACCCLAAGAGAADPPPTRGVLLLDESAYWHYYVEFGMDRLDPAALKAEGKEVLGRQGMARLRKAVQRWSGPPYVEKDRVPDFAKVDWRDQAPFFVTQVANCGCDDERISFHTRSPAPADGWMKPDFPPGEWMRQRLPLLVGNVPPRGRMHGVGEMAQPLVRAAYFRTTFDVPDPTRAGRLSLALTFRGGVRVFVNGEELTRSHLGAGPIGPDTPAQGYPRQAYVCLDDEVARHWSARTARRTGGGFVPYCPDLVGTIDAAFAPVGRKATEHYGGIVNRKGWERITQLRNRTCGPVEVPARLLRKGANVLAIEVRAADLHPIVAAGKGGDWGRSYYMGARFSWAHCRLLEVSLRCADAGAPSALRRPAGTQVWVEDVHRRLYGPDFGPPDPAGQAVRIVAAVNGTYAGLIAVAGSTELSGLKVSTGALRSADGSAEIPASAIRVAYLVGHPVSRMVKLGQWRGLPEIVDDPVCPTSWMALLRHGPEALRRSPPPRSEVMKLMEGLEFFDHISAAAPRRVPAGTCQPVWISLTVPPDARAGTYRGSVEVSAAGMKPLAVPVEVEVFGWHVPAPRHFQSFFAGEQCPYGVAKRYGLEKGGLWSDEHFRLMAGSFRELARLGCRWVVVPVINVTEFGNLDDSMIRWVRTDAPGAPPLSFDFRILDRYLDLATEHLGRPEAVCFVVAHGTSAGAPASVRVLDQRTGKLAKLDLSKASPHYRDHWGAFSSALYRHMQSRGLGEALYWGFGWDGIGDPDLIPLLSEFVPEAVRWARGSHAPNRAPGGWGSAFTASSFIYGVPITENSRRGWQRPTLFMLNPRAGCSVVSANGHSPPFAYRMLMSRALTAGCRGIARIGADYWEDVFYRGYEGRAWAGSLPGMGCLGLLWPGPEGAEPSQRGEMLLEGIQETEARIFLEQLLDRRLLPEPLARRVNDALTRHHRETLYFPVGRIGIQIQEYSAGWQGRSAGLYAAAEAAAKVVPLDVNKTRLVRTVSARGPTTIGITLRNWTARPRSWKASADVPWLVPARKSGTLAGHETLPVMVEADRLQPGTSAEGTLTITDVAGGRSHPVRFAVQVGQVFDLVVGPTYDYLGAPGHAASFGPRRIRDFATFNVVVGGSERREFVLTNLSGAELAWKIASPAEWVKVRPDSGTLPPAARAIVGVAVAPPDRHAATHEVALTIEESARRGLPRRGEPHRGEHPPARRQASMVVHVIPPYKAPPLPAGRPVRLAELPREKVKVHRSRAYWYGTSDPGREDYGPKYDEKGNIPAGTPQLTVYDIAGGGFKAFSARVTVGGGPKRVRESNGRKKVSFEVHVDGRLRAQSGLMTAADPPRLLVVGDLAAARELKLYVRWDRPEPKYLGGTIGVAWQEPRLYR